MFKAFALTCCLFCNYFMFSQKEQQDSVLLPSAEIVAHNKLSRGTQIMQLDSSALSKNKNTSLNDLLQNQTALFIKQYGSSQLSTISIRGASASQTQIFWCGFNINNAMLGQLDLSTIPVNTIQNAQLILGATSTAYGSGAIGGVISINENKIKAPQKNELNLNLSLGAFGQKNVSVQVIHQWKNISTQFSNYYHNSKNDFTYTNRIKPELGLKRMINNQQKHFGFSGQAQLKINEKNFIHYNLLWHEQNRNIPPTLLQDTSIAQQRDGYLKNNIAFTHFFTHSKISLNAALMRDILNYKNGFKSNSTVISWMNSALYEATLLRSIVWQSKVQFNRVQANFENYDQTKTQLLQYQLSSHLDKTWKNKIHTSASVRYEIQNNRSTPLIFQLGGDMEMYRNFNLKYNIGNVFRWPTLNDLYWREGGNRNLKPERGWQSEIGLSYQYKNAHFISGVSSVAFYRNIQDWIIWLPNANFWSPENIAKVESKGLENKVSLQYKYHDFTFALKCHYDHILSINKKKRFENDATYNQQLIYVPIQQAFTELNVNYKNTSFAINRKYNGFRYTSADNSDYINGFWISNISLQQHLKIKTNLFHIGIHINNLENKNFEYILFYPSMGINYQISLTIKIK
jgi:vitamin B12 transporter